MSFKDKVREVFGNVTMVPHPPKPGELTMSKQEAEEKYKLLTSRMIEKQARAEANSWPGPGSALGAQQAAAAGGYLIPPASPQAQNMSRPTPRNTGSTTINIQKVANGTLVIMSDHDYNRDYRGIPWERAWIVPEGDSVTDVIAQAIAVERLTTP